MSNRNLYKSLKASLLFLTWISGMLLCLAFVKPKHIKVFMSGDSTMANKKPDRYPETGWGQVFGSYFTDEVEIINLSMNGRSTKSFITEKRWQKLIDAVNEGDYVFIEFGHNDEKVDKSELGTTPAEFETNLTRFVRDVKDKKGIPVLLSPVSRRLFKSGKLIDTHGAYPAVVKKVAVNEQVAFIDMHQKSTVLLEKAGQEESRQLYLIADSGKLVNFPKGINDNTHFSERGANAMAQLAIEGIQEIKLPLAAFIKPSK